MKRLLWCQRTLWYHKHGPRVSERVCPAPANPTPARRWSGRASAYSLMASATSLGIAAGPLVGGALGALYGLRPVFLVTARVLILGLRGAHPPDAAPLEREPHARVPPLPAAESEPGTLMARSLSGAQDRARTQRR